MGEGTHATMTTANPGKKRTWTLTIAGTAVALLVGGIMLQVMRPQPAFPDAASGVPAETSGRATVKDQSPGAKALARVGKQVISWDEVATECMARYGQEVLDNMINRAIIQQACHEQGIEITEAEVNAEIVEIAKRFGLAVDQWLQMLQAERNVSPAQYRRDIIWPMLALRKLAGEQVTISSDDLKKAFIRNYGPRVKARAIVLDNPRRASEVWEKVRATPQDFGRLAREHSLDPASRPLDGAIPPIRAYGGSPELEKAAFKLREGEYSGVIQVGLNQYIILMCEGRTEQVVTDIEDVREILQKELKEEKTQETVAKVFEKVKAEARVYNYLTGQTTGGDKKAATGQVRQTSGEAPAGGNVGTAAENGYGVGVPGGTGRSAASQPAKAPVRSGSGPVRRAAQPQ